MTELQRLRADLIESGEFDQVVADSTFRQVSIDLDRIGEYRLAVVWSLEYPELGAYLHRVSWEYFGADGLN